MNEPEARSMSQTTIEIVSRRADGTIKDHTRINPDGTETKII